jgi:hypothetical protein
MIHDAEMDVEVAHVDMEKARDKLAQLRLALREKRAEGQGEGRIILFISCRYFIYWAYKRWHVWFFVYSSTCNDAH